MLKPTIAITTSARPVIRIVFNRLNCSSSPISPTSRKPTEIVIVNTSSAAIKTHRLFVVYTTPAPSLTLDDMPTTGARQHTRPGPQAAVRDPAPHAATRRKAPLAPSERSLALLQLIHEQGQRRRDVCARGPVSDQPVWPHGVASQRNARAGTLGGRPTSGSSDERLVHARQSGPDRWRPRGRTRQNGRMEAIEVPSGHTPDGGVLVGSRGARRRLVVFEDPQCPYCREFEDVSGDRLRREVAAGAVAVEYRIRSFLGDESVRAANALAAAAEAGRFDELRREIFVNQPPEHSGGFTTEDLLDLGRR